MIKIRGTPGKTARALVKTDQKPWPLSENRQKIFPQHQPGPYPGRRYRPPPGPRLSAPAAPGPTRERGHPASGDSPPSRALLECFSLLQGSGRAGGPPGPPGAADGRGSLLAHGAPTQHPLPTAPALFTLQVPQPCEARIAPGLWCRARACPRWATPPGVGTLSTTRRRACTQARAELPGRNGREPCFFAPTVWFFQRHPHQQARRQVRQRGGGGRQRHGH